MSDDDAAALGAAAPVAAPTTLARSVERLVATLAQARDEAVEGGGDAALAALVAQARQQLDLADEHLLTLDRHRQRSAFRQAERIRQRLDALESLIAAQTALP